MASHVLEAVDKRLGGASARGSHVTLGGQRMNLSGDLPPQAGPGRRPAIHSPTLFGPAWDERAGLTYGYRDMSMRDFMLRSSFFVSTDTPVSGKDRRMRWTAWGRGDPFPVSPFPFPPSRFTLAC